MIDYFIGVCVAKPIDINSVNVINRIMQNQH
jgi:hypothetical protein